MVMGMRMIVSMSMLVGVLVNMDLHTGAQVLQLLY